MKPLTQLVNSLIKGSRYQWYYSFHINGMDFSGGYFYFKRDARAHLLNMIYSHCGVDRRLAQVLLSAAESF